MNAVNIPTYQKRDISRIYRLIYKIYLVVIFSLVTASGIFPQSPVKKTENILSERNMLTLGGMVTLGTTDYQALPGGGAFLNFEHYFRTNNRSLFGFYISASGNNVFGEDKRKSPDGFKTDLISVGAGGLYSLGISRFVSSYISLGPSLIWFNPMLAGNSKAPNNALDAYSNFSVCYNAGAGVKIPLYKIIFLNLSANMSYLPNDNLDDMTAGDFNDYFISGTVGISIALSSKNDSDDDGIPNSEDNCDYNKEDYDGFEDEDGCPETDNDRDGILDSKDGCPNNAEDMDGFKDYDGCPEPDNDNDGIMDEQDKCTNLAEDFDGIEDTDGCPDYDNDNDGILDSRDSCIDKAEDLDGFEDEDGCPELDNDNDGIFDEQDKCPNLLEDFDGFGDTDGCPDYDNDNDGIIDSVDKCPNNPETINNYQDTDGCPDAPGQRSNQREQGTEAPPRNNAIPQDEVSVQMDVTFIKDKAEIRPEARPILYRIASYIKKYPGITWRIEAHLDNGSISSENEALAMRRAQAVRTYFVNNGIPAARFEIQYMGDKEPIERNSSAYGRMKNRRIEIKRVE